LIGLVDGPEVFGRPALNARIDAAVSPSAASARR
jgi:hypothetical protein